MSEVGRKYWVGDIRPSQILFSFGVGSVIDLPNLTVMVMGLEEWSPGAVLQENRLLAAVQRHLGEQVEHLRKPPLLPDGVRPNPYDPGTLIGIPVAPFPNWVVCPACRRLSPLREGVFTLKEGRGFRTDQTRYTHALCVKDSSQTVIPTRFLTACPKGHLDDFPWLYFVHRGLTTCEGPLNLVEYGATGAASEIEVSCQAENCNARRRMAEAFGEAGKRSMPRCRGRQPHTRSFSPTPCTEQMKTILLGASNLWFPVSLSVLHVPTESHRLLRLLEKYWPHLSRAKSLDSLEMLLESRYDTNEMLEFKAYKLNEVWQAFQQKKNETTLTQPAPTRLKDPEWKVLSAANVAENTEQFRLVPVGPPEGYERYFSKVVLVERLREVRALIGFTRIESPYDFLETGTSIEEIRSPLSARPPRWVPASEVLGEGIFIEFDEAAIQAWLELKRPQLEQLELRMSEAYRRWREQRFLDPKEGFPGLRFMLLHSFSHALIRQLALECGYGGASLRERIYSRRPTEEGGPMAGVLLYTSAPDSEGTLGGLVSLGTPEVLGRHIGHALEQMELCASDPLCAEHDPSQSKNDLHWAACHACLFSSETSCERGNRFLDRSVLVATLKAAETAFFDETHSS